MENEQVVYNRITSNFSVSRHYVLLIIPLARIKIVFSCFEDTKNDVFSLLGFSDSSHI